MTSIVNDTDSKLYFKVDAYYDANEFYNKNFKNATSTTIDIVVPWKFLSTILIVKPFIDFDT